MHQGPVEHRRWFEDTTVISKIRDPQDGPVKPWSRNYGRAANAIQFVETEAVTQPTPANPQRVAALHEK